MQSYKIRSYAKINLSLGVLGKLKSRLHKIESLILFLNLYDNILIKKIKNKKHIVKFTGNNFKKVPPDLNLKLLVKNAREKIKNSFKSEF